MAANNEGSDVVLIVDDDESIREALELALEFENYATAVVSDGKKALEWLGKHPPPVLILLDLMMPVMDGWQVLEHLRKDDRLAKIPVVVITAFGRDLGSAADLPTLRKPIELKDLLKVVGTYCRHGA